MNNHSEMQEKLYNLPIYNELDSSNIVKRFPEKKYSINLSAIYKEKELVRYLSIIHVRTA